MAMTMYSNLTIVVLCVWKRYFVTAFLLILKTLCVSSTGNTKANVSGER